MSDESVRKLIKDKCGEKGWKIIVLANNIQQSRSHVSRVLNGKERLSDGFLAAVNAALELEEGTLFRERKKSWTPGIEPALPADVGKENRVQTDRADRAASLRWLLGVGGVSALAVTVGIVTLLNYPVDQPLGEVDPVGESFVSPGPKNDPRRVPNVTESPARTGQPEPLDEWLVDRDVITVSLDGEAHFSSLQGALDAVAPGQVVRVLDRGPYHESIALDTVPKGIGIVTSERAVIDIPQQESSEPIGHRVNAADGLRIEGFRFNFQMVSAFDGLILENCSNVTIHDCDFTCNTPTAFEKDRNGLSIFCSEQAPPSTRLSVTNCLFVNAGFRMAVDSPLHNSVVMIGNNYFTGSGYKPLRLGPVSRVRRYVVEDNIIDTVCPVESIGCGQQEEDIGAELLLRRNTIVGPKIGFGVYLGIPRVHVERCILPNVFIAPSAIPALETDGRRRMTRSENFYWNMELGQPLSLLVPHRSEAVGTADILNSDRTEHNYLHVLDPSPFHDAAIAAAYVGALPYGPAPDEGDWFTRLRERLNDVLDSRFDRASAEASKVSVER